jgi:hypothetical protein
MNLPSHPWSGASHRRHAIWRSGSGPASARTSLYSARQFGQSKREISGITPPFGKGGQSKSLAQLWPQVAPPSYRLHSTRWRLPSPNVEGRGRGQWHRLARFGLQRCDKTELAKVSVSTLGDRRRPALPMLSQLARGQCAAKASDFWGCPPGPNPIADARRRSRSKRTPNKQSSNVVSISLKVPRGDLIR